MRFIVVWLDDDNDLRVEEFDTQAAANRWLEQEQPWTKNIMCLGSVVSRQGS